MVIRLVILSPAESDSAFFVSSVDLTVRAI